MGDSLRDDEADMGAEAVVAFLEAADELICSYSMPEEVGSINGGTLGALTAHTILSGSLLLHELEPEPPEVVVAIVNAGPRIRKTRVAKISKKRPLSTELIWCTIRIFVFLDLCAYREEQ